jgi:hypothetical protein
MRAHYGMMSSASYYRAEAQRCRELAANAVQGSIMADRWLTIAGEYEMLAKALEAAPDAGAGCADAAAAHAAAASQDEEGRQRG